MSKVSELTHEYLRSVLDYNPETGIFTRKIAQLRWKSGATSGSVNPRGYRSVKIGKKSYLAHRLAWFWMTSKWPSNQIDHKDGDPSNNKWENLREATQSQNNQNRRRTTGKAGLKGASWVSSKNKWAAYLSKDGKRITLGLFGTAEEAHLAFVAAAKINYGEFAKW